MSHINKKSSTRVVAIVFTLGLLHAINACAGTLDEYLDYEDATIEADYDIVDNNQVYQNLYEGSYSAPVLTTEQKRAGSYSQRYEVGANTGSKDRMETYIELNSGYYPGLNHNIWQKTKYLGFSVYFPTTFTTPDSWLVFYQIKQHDGNVNPSPNICLEAEDGGRIRATVRWGNGIIGDPNTKYKSYYLGNISDYKGKWTDFVLKFKVTNQTDGFVQIWKKSSTEAAYAKVVDHAGQTGYTACRTDKFEIKGGIYRGAELADATLYQDEIRYGNTIGDVKMPGSTINEFTFEAESASAQSAFPPLQVVTDAAASGGAYMDAVGHNRTTTSPVSGQAAYSFNLGTAADIALAVTVLGSHSGADSFYYKIDGGAWNVWYLTPSPDWQRPAKNITGLASGNHTVTLAYREGACKLDKVEVSTK